MQLLLVHKLALFKQVSIEILFVDDVLQVILKIVAIPLCSTLSRSFIVVILQLSLLGVVLLLPLLLIHPLLNRTELQLQFQLLIALLLGSKILLAGLFIAQLLSILAIHTVLVLVALRRSLADRN